MQVTCESCGEAFEAKRKTARFCGSTCRTRARRAKAAEPEIEPAGTAEGKPTAGLKPEDPLVTAVRKELEAAKALDSVDGQIALHLAHQVKAATGSSASTLAKELRQVLDRIAPPAPPTPAGPAPVKPEDDEVTRARRRREEIAAAAAEGDA